MAASGRSPAGRKPTAGDREPRRCTAWESEGLDPGWAGVLAETFLATPSQPSFIIYRPGRDLLPLIEDAIALLPVEQSWSVTFTTYFTGLPPNVPCVWRCVLAGSSEARQATRISRGLILDLDAPGEPRGDELVELARTGTRTTRTVVRPLRDGIAGSVDADAPGPFRGRTTTGPPHPLRNPNSYRSGTAGAEGHPAPRSPPPPSRLYCAWCAVIFWLADQSVPNPPKDVITAKTSSVKLAKRAEPEPEPAPANLPLTKSLEPKPEPAKEAPKIVAKAEPKPEPKPDPNAVQAKAVRFANVGLPIASKNLAEHDPAPRVLEPNLPPAPRYALVLRGLNDPEAQGKHLVVDPPEPGREDTLTVTFDPISSGGTAATVAEKTKLAKFWIDGSRLYFQWLPKSIPASQVEPSKVLRNCILEVRGGDPKLKLALFGSLKDPQELTVHKAPKTIAWKRGMEKPIHKLVILKCAVKINNTWLDVPATPDEPNLRRRTIPASQSEENDRAILNVQLLKDGTQLNAILEPSAREVAKEILRLQSDEAGQKAHLKDLKGLISGFGHELRMLNEQRTGAEA